MHVYILEKEKHTVLSHKNNHRKIRNIYSCQNRQGFIQNCRFIYIKEAFDIQYIMVNQNDSVIGFVSQNIRNIYSCQNRQGFIQNCRFIYIKEAFDIQYIMVNQNDSVIGFVSQNIIGSALKILLARYSCIYTQICKCVRMDCVCVYVRAVYSLYNCNQYYERI